MCELNMGGRGEVSRVTGTMCEFVPEILHNFSCGNLQSGTQNLSRYYHLDALLPIYQFQISVTRILILHLMYSRQPHPGAGVGVGVVGGPIILHLIFSRYSNTLKLPRSDVVSHKEVHVFHKKLSVKALQPLGATTTRFCHILAFNQLQQL